MDRQLAERMVGAACLLAVLVLVVPAILDGNPDSGATITHPSVDEAQDPKTQTCARTRSGWTGRSAPIPACRLPRSRLPDPEPAPAAVPRRAARCRTDRREVRGWPQLPAARQTSDSPRHPPVPARARRRRPPRRLRADGRLRQPAAVSGSFSWAAFPSARTLTAWLATLKAKGFSASVLGGGGASGTLFRVRAGPEPDRAAAEALAARLAAAGFAGGRVGRK